MGGAALPQAGMSVGLKKVVIPSGTRRTGGKRHPAIIGSGIGCPARSAVSLRAGRRLIIKRGFHRDRATGITPGVVAWELPALIGLTDPVPAVRFIFDFHVGTSQFRNRRTGSATAAAWRKPSHHFPDISKPKKFFA